jgi:hypothetical protein
MRNVRRAQDAGIIGLEGTIASGDWAYSTGKEARMATYVLEQMQSQAP